MAQYSGLAAIYDQLMQGIDYSHWATYITSLAALHGGLPEQSALDLACGTGSTTTAMAKAGFRATGLDLSPEMLELAEEKSVGLAVSYLCADMRSFSLPAPVGLVTSFQDGINYLLSPEDLRQAFTRVRQALLPGGLFIFDINRVEKLAGVAADLSWADCGDFALIWETRFVETDIWEISVTGFAKTSGDLFRKFTETHRERVIPHREVSEALQQAGMTLLALYGAFSTSAPDESTRRVFYVAKRGA
jgi:SAM-dependent methyltransferase